MSDFEHFERIMNIAVKFKQKMLDKSIKAARTPCPHCKVGFLHARLAGRKNHFSMKCDNAQCSIFMME